MKNTTATHFIEVFYDMSYKGYITSEIYPIHMLQNELNISKRQKDVYTVAVFLITPKNKENENI